MPILCIRHTPAPYPWYLPKAYRSSHFPLIYDPYLFHGSFLFFRWSCHPPPDPSSFSLVFTGVLCNEDIALQLAPLSLFIFFFFNLCHLHLHFNIAPSALFSITLPWPGFVFWLVIFFPFNISPFLSSVIYLILFGIPFCSLSAFSRIFSLLFFDLSHFFRYLSTSSDTTQPLSTMSQLNSINR